jgi:ribosomal protein S18 acetylase RimI-like enzyme
VTKLTVALSQVEVSFPAERSDCDGLVEPAPLSERGFSLRTARDDDLPWLRELYASTRAEEMAPVPWPEATKHAFLDQQFKLQHHHFVGHFPHADFWLIVGARGPIGRLYRDRALPADSRPADDLIVDICLLPDWRSRGLGSLLLKAAQTSAAARHRGLRLHVQVHNSRAMALYQRLGFARIDAAATGSHIEMRWTAG